MPSAVLRPLVLLVVVSLLGIGVPNALSGLAAASVAPDHLVVSEVVTGGATASDELIELHNPTSGPLPLEGLELVYASASGLTVSRRAAWELGAPAVPPGGHLLVANELGVYAPIADATYASGMAATGGSVALRIVGASSAIDAVGWGSAASTWMEGSAAPAPAAGSSLERLPGGPLGSTQDTDDNAADFAVRAVPGPENSASAPVPGPAPSGSSEPSATPAGSPTVAPTPSPVPTPTTSPSAEASAVPTPAPDVVSIAAARALPDGTEVTVEGVALTGSDFADGGGYVVDESGGLAVLLASGSFARGEGLRIHGVIDDRYAQRTLRATGDNVLVLGTTAQPAPIAIATGTVGESVEGRLVRFAGTVLGAPTELSAGMAFEVDDGSGPVRLLVGASSGVDASAWGAGFAVDAIGVVGQRDSSGTGGSGYRVQPRDSADILAAGPGPTPAPSASTSPSPDATPQPSQSADLISIAAARQLPKGAAAVIRGIVTLAPGLVDPTSAAVQDASGAILLRVGDEAGPIVRGTLVEVHGVRSTLAGMETLRVSTPPRSLGGTAEPAARSVRTGDAHEAHEAILVSVRGGLVGAPRRSSAGTTSFEIDDGSGPLRVAIGSSAGIEVASLEAGTWIEIRGVLGQETTGSLPLRGYRVWPRDASDLRVVAPAVQGSSAGASSAGGTGSGASGAAAPRTLEDLGGAAIAGMPVGATLVVGPWEELGIGGLLWDGDRLVAIAPDADSAVVGVLAGARPPVAVQATGLRVLEVDEATGIPVASLPDQPGALVPSGLAPAPPTAGVGDDAEPRWVTVVGRLDRGPSGPALHADGAVVAIDHRCDSEELAAPSTIGVTGILVGTPARLLVPCGGMAPAPLLDRSSPLVPDRRPAGRVVLATSGDDEAPPTVPAALLLLAATALAGGAVASRWAHREPEPEPEPAAVPADATEDAASPPVLTLVPMPRERAP